MRKANFSSGGTFSRYQSNKIRQLLGEETVIHTFGSCYIESVQLGSRPSGSSSHCSEINSVSAKANQVFIGTKLCSISRLSPLQQRGIGICTFN